MSKNKYLGENLSPDDYYKLCASKYNNPQSDSILEILSNFKEHIFNSVLDIGCGDGLGSKILKDFGITNCIGLDRSSEMIERYKSETNLPGFVCNFWDKLPKAKTAIVIHALHLCPSSRKWEFRWRLIEAGIENLIVISPLKRAIDNLDFDLILEKKSFSGESKKTVFGWLFDIKKYG